MFIRRDQGPVSVKLPDGSILTRGDLPPKNTRRWVIRRKTMVVMAVNAGLISLEDACRMYGLSEEEFLSWEDALLNHGSSGLRVTHLKKYRQL
ncbi:MAG: DUF1153 domain-containing protein [Paracoccaceae bacterium]